MKNYRFLILIALLSTSCRLQLGRTQSSSLLENLLREYPSYFQNIINNPGYKIQIIYTEIKRDSTGYPYFIPERISRMELSNSSMKSLRVGHAHIVDGQKVDFPIDFTYRNNLNLMDITRLVQRIIFREFMPDSLRFDISDEDYEFLEEYMSKLPEDSHNPTYDKEDYPDWWVKFCLPGVGKVFNRDNVRIFNKAGQAYGFTIDGGYFLDYDTGKEWILYAVIYTNENEILNDDVYEYKTVAYPFFEHLGEIIARYEKEKPSTYTHPVADIVPIKG